MIDHNETSNIAFPWDRECVVCGAKWIAKDSYDCPRLALHETSRVKLSREERLAESRAYFIGGCVFWANCHGGNINLLLGAVCLLWAAKSFQRAGDL